MLDWKLEGRDRTMKPTICLCMIVKNESAVIERCIASVRDIVDTWIISDTGSTDGTQDLIRKAFDGVPGELHEDPWVNFGVNRTLNIERARGKADYLLLMDADMTIRQEGPLPSLSCASYMIPHAGSLSYRIKRLVRGDLHWRYEGVTHEYLTTDEEHEQENLDALVVEHFADGGSRHDKFERDMALLSAEIERDPTNARSVFYLAQTMRDMGRTEEAIALYERRAGMGGWGEEVYYSLLQAGILKDKSGDWPGAMDTLSRAWEQRPQRLEACFELVSRLRKRGNYRAGHAFACAGIDRAEPDDILFTHPWVYKWGLLFEYSVVSYWVGDIQGSLEACDRLLSIPELPEAHRLQTLRNRDFAVARQAEESSSVVG